VFIKDGYGPAAGWKKRAARAGIRCMGKNRALPNPPDRKKWIRGQIEEIVKREEWCQQQRIFPPGGQYKCRREGA
jgi:hypothetical protein